uniref:Uncharacterized protein n=1 Tax=Streptomyces sp. NBC_00003 TaxID=2903608 RepID=A0AAU2UZU5_9ACTN
MPARRRARARLDTIAALRAAGVPAGVLIAPVIPHAGDHPDAPDALVDARAVTVFPDTMRISPGARDWFLTQSARTLPPHLHHRLAADFATRRAMPPRYVQQVTAHIHARAAHHGLPRWEDYIGRLGRNRRTAGEPFGTRSTRSRVAPP